MDVAIQANQVTAFFTMLSVNTAAINKYGAAPTYGTRFDQALNAAPTVIANLDAIKGLPTVYATLTSLDTRFTALDTRVMALEAAPGGAAPAAPAVNGNLIAALNLYSRLSAEALADKPPVLTVTAQPVSVGRGIAITAAPTLGKSVVSSNPGPAVDLHLRLYKTIILNYSQLNLLAANVSSIIAGSSWVTTNEAGINAAVGFYNSYNKSIVNKLNEAPLLTSLQLSNINNVIAPSGYNFADSSFSKALDKRTASTLKSKFSGALTNIKSQLAGLKAASGPAGIRANAANITDNPTRQATLQIADAMDYYVNYFQAIIDDVATIITNLG